MVGDRNEERMRDEYGYNIIPGGENQLLQVNVES